MYSASHLSLHGVQRQNPARSHRGDCGVDSELLSQSNTALVLSTSWRQLEAVVDGLPAALRDHCWIQGELSKRRNITESTVMPSIKAMLPYHRIVILRAEGIDLPGATVSTQILCKLPFAVPDDPMGNLKRMVRRPRAGCVRNASLPMAAVRLAQAAGRLIRSETDRDIHHFGYVQLKPRVMANLLIRAIPPFAKEGF